ncbi:MAG: glutamate synthase-related protein [bacterium]
MPKKYHIHVQPAPPRFTTVGKFCIIDMYEDCARGCRNCVKRKCIYKIHEKEAEFVDHLDRPVEFMNECMNCLVCVQNCTRGALTRAVNPEFKWLGDEYWKPELIDSIWRQAATGNIPVSGAGYGGPFSGPGFDSMWTDMSEIVRPTRDGIHGREYISTSVEIGAKLSYLSFDSVNEIMVEPPPLVEIPVPFLIERPPFGDFSENIVEAMAMAAGKLETFFILDAKDITERISKYKDSLIPGVGLNDMEKYAGIIRGSKMAEITDCPDVMRGVRRIKEIGGDIVVIIRMELTNDIEERVSVLAGQGAEALLLRADIHGNVGNGNGVFIKDVFRNIHNRLVRENIRDRVTLIASGGIAMPEHMAKVIICGADCVSLGLPFLIAMECRMCRNCEKGLECPVKMAEIPPAFGAARIMNLSAAWRNQLLEVLGAMGLREMRRLRGEFGRAMFHEDLERDTFIKLFSKKVS